MEWFAQLLMTATEGCSEPVTWITCIVAGLIVITVLRGIVEIFKR